MKLKKFAAMMLAGVMAVSMLAGCSGKGTNGGNNGANQPEPTPETGIVAAFNDGQSTSNKAKVTFSSDASLDAAMKKVAAAVEVYEIDSKVEEYVQAATGLGTVIKNFFDANSKTVKNGATVTKLYVEIYTNTDDSVWSEDAAMKKAANAANDVIKALADTTYEKGVTKDKYFDYSYTGDVSMVSVAEVNGVVNYYVAYTITQTAAEKTIEAK